MIYIGYSIYMEDKSAYKWFCEQYDGNEIAQGLIGQLSQANRYLPDRWSVTYGQHVHASVEIGDLVEVPGIPERATLDCMSQIPAEQSSTHGSRR